MNGTHPKFEIPTDPHGKHRYESAMKHVEAAKKAANRLRKFMLSSKR